MIYFKKEGINLDLIYPVATPETTSTRILAYRGNLEIIFNKLSNIGYKGVELMVRDPSMIDIKNISKMLDYYHLKAPVIGTGQIYNDGLSFTDNDESSRKTAIGRCVKAVQMAAELNSMVIFGKVRGRYEVGVEKEIIEERAKEAFNIILKEAEKYKINIVLEPQSRVGTDFLNPIPECIKWIKNFNHSNFKIMGDTFHMNIEDTSIIASLIKASPYLVHIHLSDNNRLAPGLGSLNFNEILKVLDALNYKGSLSIEVFQRPNSEEVALHSFNYINNILRLING